jgi:hypothetical protein
LNLLQEPSSNCRMLHCGMSNVLRSGLNPFLGVRYRLIRAKTEV